MAGQPGEHRRFSLDEGCLPCYAPAYFHRGAAPFFPPIPQGMGNTKAPIEEKRWEQCFIFRISWKFKPQGLSQTARGNGGTIRKARKIFLPVRANSPVMHQCIFAEGWPHLFPQSRREWETQKLPPKKKGGSSILKAEPIDKAEGKKTKKGLGGTSCTLPQPLQMRKLKCMPPPAFRAAFSFPPVKTSCFIGVQLRKKFVVLPADEMVKIPNFYPQVSFLHCTGGGFLLC